MAKTFLELMEMAAEVRDETAQGENTALRVGGLLAELVEYLRGCTLAEDVSVAAESGRVLLRFSRHDAEGTAFFQDVVIGAADAETAGVMTAEKVALVEGHSAEIASVASEVSALENKVTLQGKLINGHTTALSSVNALLKTHEANILAAQELAQTAQSAADDAQTAADDAATKAESAATTAALAQSVASECKTSANAASAAALKAQVAATNAQTKATSAQSAADANAADIETLTQKASMLEQYRESHDFKLEGIHNLGDFATGGDAYARLSTVEMAGDIKKRIFLFTVGTAQNGVVLQTIANNCSKQFLYFANNFFQRSVYFTNNNRTAVNYTEKWQFLIGDRLSWNADSHKLLLSQFGAAFNDDCTDAIPTATNERDGLMTKELVKRIETLENKVAAYHPL